MSERIILSELKKGKGSPEASASDMRRIAVGRGDTRLWTRRIGGAALGCTVAAIIYKLNHVQSASAFVWLRDPLQIQIDINALTHMVTAYNAAFFFGAIAGAAVARGRILFSLGLALLIVLAVAIPFHASEIADGIGPAQYIDPSDTEGIKIVYRASRLVQFVEMAGGFVMASLGANLGSRVSRWIVKEPQVLDV